MGESKEVTLAGDEAAAVPPAKAVDYSQDLKAHAELLAGFFGSLFKPGETVHIVPVLRGGRRGADGLPKAGRTFSRRAASTSTRNLADLHALNRAGYDVFFCLNPLCHTRRCQRAVVAARHILVEMDRSGFDTQRIMLQAHGGSIAAAVHSGGKSIHMLVRLAPPVRSPNRLGWRTLSRLKRGSTSAPWPLYRRMADWWISVFAAAGHPVDERAARDYARLTRVPGFRHAGTGAVAAVERVDPLAKWDWRKALADDEEEGDCGETSDDLAARHADLEAIAKWGHAVAWRGSNVLFPELLDGASSSSSPQSPQKRAAGGAGAPALDMGRLPRGHSPSPPSAPVGTAGSVEPVCDPSGTIAVRSTARTHFLDDLERFGQLRSSGLPGRGTRMRLHKVAFTAARVFGWPEDRLAAEWRAVIRRNASATDKTEEEAAASIVGDWRANRGRTLYLPDLARLPALGGGNMAAMGERLERMGCPDPSKAVRIITRVVLPLIRTVPAQCLRGTANILAADLRDATNVRGNRGYATLWAWMQKAGIVDCKDRRYRYGCKASRPRRYRVNVPIVLWLCGYRTADLVWGRAKRRAGSHTAAHD